MIIDVKTCSKIGVGQFCHILFVVEQHDQDLIYICGISSVNSLENHEAI